MVGTEMIAAYWRCAMMKSRKMNIANTRELPWNYKQAGRQPLRVFPILLMILLSQLVSGCANHSNQATEGTTTSGARLVDMGNGICQDTKTGKMWQVESSQEIIKSLAEAQSYSANLEEGGYHDWRLPMISELYDLYIIFDLHENGNCNLDPEGTYWSGEADLEDRVGTWELDDNCDPERQYVPKKRGHVRAIRP